MFYKNNLILIFSALCYTAEVNSKTKGVRGAIDQQMFEEVLNPEECNRQLVILANHSLGFTFLDASGRFPSGIQSGNLNDMGDYFECLKVNEIVNGSHISGKYCMVAIPTNQDIDIPPLPMPDVPVPDEKTLKRLDQFTRIERVLAMIFGIRGGAMPRALPPTSGLTNIQLQIALCLPRVCSTKQVVDFIMESDFNFNVMYSETFCRLPKDKPIVVADYVAIVIFSLIGLLVIISTGYDVFFVFALKKDSDKLLRCFSVYTNTRRLLTFEKDPGSLECLNGIRTISMMWVIVGHDYVSILLNYVHNMLDVLSWASSWNSIWINSAPVTVDTFFLLSGILCVYTVIGKAESSSFLRHLPIFYLNRLLRMFPLLAAVVLLQASLFNHVADGPNWQSNVYTVETCRKYWWSALLHVQNYVNPTEMCLSQTWYLSTDVQLYFACPLVLYWLFGRKKLAFVSLFVAVLASVISSCYYSYSFDFPASLVNINRIDMLSNYFKKYYVNTLARAAPFCIGMVYGYLLHIWKNKEIIIAKPYVYILWTTSSALLLFCILSTYLVIQPEHTAQWLDNFLNAFMRSFWAASLGWVILACVKGYGGPVNWFLSLPVWRLPARLSYAMYLTHYSILMISVGTWVKPYYFTETNNLYRYFSDLSLTFIVSLVLSIVIDAPFSTLQKMILYMKKPLRATQKLESLQTITEENGSVIK